MDKSKKSKFSLVAPSLLFHIILLLNATPTNTIKIPKQVVRDQPKLWMSGYTKMDSYQMVRPPDKRFRLQEQFENDFVSKNGSDFVISSETYSVTFTCEADYPIFWKFPFPKQLEFTSFQDIHSSDFRISDLSIDNPEPANRRFQSLISMYCSQFTFLSANLTCSGIDTKPQELSSVYIYFNGGKTNIENEGKTLQVTLESSKPNIPLVLPCRPSSPDVKLSLQMEVLNYYYVQPNLFQKPISKKEWEPLSLQRTYISYDPKVGFILQRGLLGDRIFGLYKCSVVISSDDNDGEVDDSDQFVLVNVTKRTSQVEMDDHPRDMVFEPRSILHGKASVRMEDLPDGDFPTITCCSGVKDKPPKLFKMYCESPMQCEMVKKAVVEMLDPESEHELKSPVSYRDELEKIPSDCQKEILFGKSEVVACRGDNLEFVEQYFSLFYPMAGGPVINRTRRIQEAEAGHHALKNKSDADDPLHKRLISLTHYEPSSIAQTAAITQKIFMAVGKQIRKPKDKRLSHNIYFISQDEIYLYDDDINEKGDLITRPKRTQYHVLEYNRDVYYEGEPLLFMCFGTKFVYSREAHLRLNWENGSKSTLEEETPGKNPLYLYQVYLRDNANMMAGNGNQLVFAFGRSVRASQGMKSVDCWMPIRNSSRWDRSSKELKILACEAPRFEEKEEETLYFYLGDAGNKVVCTVVGGPPLPFMMVTRDGRKLKMNFKVQKLSTNSSSTEKGVLNDPNTHRNNKLRIPITTRFSDIRHDHQSVFKCIARNAKGTATRTITVFVIDRPSKALPISLSIAGILSLLVIGLGLKHWHAKRTVASLLATNNL